MSTTSSKLPLSLPNTILVGGCLVGAAISGILGSASAAIVLAIIGVGGLVFALIARRPNAGDWLRINSIEYRDERDKSLAMRAFAAVGIVALILALAAVIASILYAGAVGQTPTAVAFQAGTAVQLLILAIAWSWANTVVIRRG